MQETGTLERKKNLASLPEKTKKQPPRYYKSLTLPVFGGTQQSNAVKLKCPPWRARATAESVHSFLLLLRLPKTARRLPPPSPK